MVIDTDNKKGNKHRELSLRQKAFYLFDFGYRPAQLARDGEMSLSTACTYYTQWKKLPPFYLFRCRLARDIWRDFDSRDFLIIATCLARELNTKTRPVLEAMQKPWVIEQIITGRWRNWKMPEREEPNKNKGVMARINNIIAELTSSDEVKFFLQMALDQTFIPEAWRDLGQRINTNPSTRAPSPVRKTVSPALPPRYAPPRAATNGPGLSKTGRGTSVR